MRPFTPDFGPVDVKSSSASKSPSPLGLQNVDFCSIQISSRVLPPSFLCYVPAVFWHSSVGDAAVDGSAGKRPEELKSLQCSFSGLFGQMVWTLYKFHPAKKSAVVRSGVARNVNWGPPLPCSLPLLPFPCPF